MKRKVNKIYDSREYDSIEQALIELRNERGVTQYQLVEFISKALEYAKHMDSGEVSLDPVTQQIILGVIGYDFNDLQRRVDKIRADWDKRNN